jgi:hypothetical protein
MADDNAFAAAQLAAALIQAGNSKMQHASISTAWMPFVRKAKNDTRSMRRSRSGPLPPAE